MMKMDAKWDGAVFVPTEPEKVDLREGARVRLNVLQHRSHSQHGLFFAAMALAFDNWPDGHPFQPKDAEQLRYWLEIRAGWGSSLLLRDPTTAVEYMSNYWRDNMWAEQTEEGFVVHRAKSIAYSKMQKGDFVELVNRVDTVLQQEVGMSIADLKLSLMKDAQ